MVMATLALAIFTSQTVAFRHGTFVAFPHCSRSVCKPQENFSLLPRRCHQGCIQLRAATQHSASKNPQNYKGPAKIGGVNLQTAYLVAGCSTAASWIGCAIFALATYTPWRVVHNSIGWQSDIVVHNLKLHIVVPYIYNLSAPQVCLKHSLPSRSSGPALTAWLRALGTPFTCFTTTNVQNTDAKALLEADGLGSNCRNAGGWMLRLRHPQSGTQFTCFTTTTCFTNTKVQILTN
jgi:hypothetical protein